MDLPMRLLVITLAGFIQRDQQQVIDYLLEDNRILRQQMGTRRLRLTDAQRRRLAIRAKILGRATLRNLSTVGHQVARSTVARVLNENGVDPSPNRSTSWATFLKVHFWLNRCHGFLCGRGAHPRGSCPLRLPAKSPNLNAFAERFIGSIRRECLDHVVPLGERHLRLVVREYVEHYNRERHPRVLRTNSSGHLAPLKTTTGRSKIAPGWAAF